VLLGFDLEILDPRSDLMRPAEFGDLDGVPQERE
jgi:hypothetical protein